MTELPSVEIDPDGASPDRLHVRAHFAGIAPAELYRWFAEADRLTQWWPEKAATDPRVGGEYTLEWPEQGWTLRGTFRAASPGEELAYSWAWDHEPDRPPREVTVAFTSGVAGTDTAGTGTAGTRVDITHGPYGAGEDEAKERQGHVEGWTYFLGRLRDRLAELA